MANLIMEKNVLPLPFQSGQRPFLLFKLTLKRDSFGFLDRLWGHVAAESWSSASKSGRGLCTLRAFAAGVSIVPSCVARPVTIEDRLAWLLPAPLGAPYL